jgi:anti-sigma B factor antagonist
MPQALPAARAAARPTVVTLPDEIDMANAGRIDADLQAAFASAVSVVVADMTATTFCDAMGIRALVRARKRAAACDAELRVVVPSARILRVLAVLDLDNLLEIYPSLREALATEPAARPVVVPFPAQLDVSNADDVAGQLRAAIAAGDGAVVADLTATVLRDSSGVDVILLALDRATADHVELRLAVPPGPALEALKLAGLDELVPIYPALDEALAGGLAPDAGAPHG